MLSKQSGLPSPDELAGVHGTQTGLYIVLLIATLLLGTGEVLRDNCGQTFMPSIVEVDQLEVANGRMWSAEGIANTFVGPPLGSLLLLAAFALPFFVDAASFFAAAALGGFDPRQLPRRTTRRARSGTVAQPSSQEGFRWLWSNELLRSMAIILGLMNMASTLSGSVLVLFSQEILKIGPLLFTIMGFGFAAGGATRRQHRPVAVETKLGSGTCLAITLGSAAIDIVPRRPSSWWPLVGALFAIDGHARRVVERDHSQPAPGDHPAAPARQGQQRVPLLRLGDDAHRRSTRRRHRHRDEPPGRPSVRAALGVLPRRHDLRLPVHRRPPPPDHGEARSCPSTGACLSSASTQQPNHPGGQHMPLGENLSEQSILAERAKALVPLLDQEAEFADTQGELSPAVVEALHREGLLKMWVPEKLGGAELDPVHSLEVLENLSYGDASAAGSPWPPTCRSAPPAPISPTGSRRTVG